MFEQEQETAPPTLPSAEYKMLPLHMDFKAFVSAGKKGLPSTITKLCSLSLIFIADNLQASTILMR